jgi:hypothetical protein
MAWNGCNVRLKDILEDTKKELSAIYFILLL